MDCPGGLCGLNDNMYLNEVYLSPSSLVDRPLADRVIIDRPIAEGLATNISANESSVGCTFPHGTLYGVKLHFLA